SGSSGALAETRKQFKATDVGLPGYIDQKVGDRTVLPRLDFDRIEDIGDGFPAIDNRATTGELRASLNLIKGDHSLKVGLQERRYWSTRGGPGQTTGTYTFRNNYVRAADNDNRSANHGLDWAAFMLGMPTGISIPTNDSGYYTTPFRGIYFQDDWRITRRLRFNLGLRYEREAGTFERFNRGLAGGFDFGAKFPFSDLVEAAYAQNPIPQVPASQFQVRGAASYLGDRYNTYTDGTHHFLPRLGVVYQINNKTVLRSGYGVYYDTYNAFNDRPPQDGYSQSTGTVITTDNGLTFCCGLGASDRLAASTTLLADPFPVRATGTRFDAPYGNALGGVILAGRGSTLPPRNFDPARQQRWRIGVQREIRSDVVVDVSYNGAYATIPVNQRIDFLPQQYWATGNVRRQAVDDDLNTNLPNPFNIRNLGPLQSSNPLVYNYLSTQGFFSGTTIRKNTLLRQFPNLNNSSGLRPGADYHDVLGGNRYHDLQFLLEKRYSRGFNTSVMYTWAHGEESDFYNNQFDAKPLVFRPQDALRPHRFVWTAIYELPFGKGRQFLTSHPLQHLAGGWQLSWIYQYQNGAATGWGNRFFYGDLDNIATLFQHDQVHAGDIHTWFDPSIAYRGAGAIPQGFQGFEGRSAMQPGDYHVRVFPTRIDQLRNDGIRNWDIKLLRKFRIHERLATTFSADLLNATNHTNFSGAQLDPTNRDFGRVTAQNGLARVIQFTLRVEF
ncbi:MAG: TonB-dependent receptor domain-containing protein, partial [Bryobacteraceae bacterium]